MGKTKIRTCEYCGGAGRLIQVRDLSSNELHCKVFCDKCERDTFFRSTKEAAVNEWNEAMEIVAKRKNPDFYKEAERKLAEECTEWE